MHITFDTLEMVRRLEAKGFKREQAEEIVSVVKDVQQDLATKQDIEALKKDIEVLGKNTKADIETLRKDTKADIEALRKDTRADIEALKADLRELELGMMVKLGILMFTLLLTFKILDKFI